MRVELVFACACLVSEVGEREAHHLCLPVAKGQDPDYSRVQVTVKREHGTVVAVCHSRSELDAFLINAGEEYHLPCVEYGAVLLVKGPH